jgi:hypothetical protein
MTSPALTLLRGSRPWRPCLSRTACERLADWIPVTAGEASALNSIPHLSRLGHCRGLEQHYAICQYRRQIHAATSAGPELDRCHSDDDFDHDALAREHPFVREPTDTDTPREEGGANVTRR